MYILGLVIYLLGPILAWFSDGARSFIVTSYYLSSEITIAIGVFYLYPMVVFLVGLVPRRKVWITRKAYKSQVILASTLAISLGLIGTFVGLANMVASIAGGMAADGDFAGKMAAMLESISDAMESMSLAFLTSILGVAASISILFSGNFIETYFPVEPSGRSGGGPGSEDTVKDELVTMREASNEKFGVLSQDLRKTSDILSDQSKLWSDLYLMLEARAGEDVIVRMTESLDVHNKVLNDLSRAIKENNEQQVQGFLDLRTAFTDAHQNSMEANERTTNALLEQAVLTREFQSNLQFRTNELIDNTVTQISEVSGILSDIRLAMALPLEELLRKAINEDKLTLVYQKQVDMKRQVVGYETYLRWMDHVRGFIPPDKIISVAREHGMIVDVNKWVFRNAIRQLSVWYRSGLWKDQMTLSINLSSEFLLSPGFTSFIRQNLSDFDVPPGLIAVEITEEVISSDPESCVDKLTQLKGMGLKCYIDDFGSGYTSLKTLRDIDVDVIKIDRGIVEDINNENLSVIKSIINIATELNILAACEGVESEEQFQRLQSLGCVLFQGYLLGKPILPEELSESE